MQKISAGMARNLGSRVNLETAGLAGIFEMDKEIAQNMINDQFSTEPFMKGRAMEVSRALVNNSGILVSRETMRNQLERDFGRDTADFVVSDRGIGMLASAAQALFRDQTGPDKKGGIDINPAFLKLLVKRDGKGIPIPTAKVPVKDTDIYGFEPVISSVEKVDDLPAFIGIEK